MGEKTAVGSRAEADQGYHDFEKVVAARAAACGGPLFTTDADPGALWAAYLDGLPANRQHYDCHACRRFIQQYAGLVSVDPSTGVSDPMLWRGHDSDWPHFFRRSVQSLYGLACRARVTGVFCHKDAVLGTPATGPWTHLSCANPAPYKGTVKTAAQAAAEKAEEYGMLRRGLEEYPRPVVEQALRVLRSDALCRAEKAEGAVRWLSELHDWLERVKGPRRDNLIWLAVATAPAGFCHVKTLVASTLMDDVKAGLEFEEVRRRWANKLHPLQYQRPQAPPSDGAIRQAEELFARLGLAPALSRRYATLDDVLKKEWVPPPKEESRGGGLFGHLRRDRKAVPGVALPRQKVTWVKFARDVLPHAMKLEVLAPAYGNYCGVVTAADPAAPPILQWDGLEGCRRNPASVYVYHGGSSAAHWGLTPGWVDCPAVFLLPHAWQEPARFTHYPNAAVFALEGCRDNSHHGLALFPETLRAELHGVRSVVEAHSKTGKIGGPELGTANGLAGFPVTVRVTDAGGTAEYEVERWE